ncbi:probable serine/threonine-protein kinase nek3 [Patella vulgata]|uniref:probable serine/threonine-protein kinase nek3 n=1 Tax=Patella vulgata TaxID=6465 RepID=UPI00217F24D3|nr:probable serine/threonine-protein kinase nek3 [Patella vulgata]
MCYTLAKESSIHAEMDQMMTSVSHPTNEQVDNNDQKETGLHTPPELVDNYMNEDKNRNVSSCDQPILLQNGHLDHDVPHHLPINDNSNNSNINNSSSNLINSASNFQQDCIIITNSTSNCSSIEHVNTYYSSVPVTGNINLLKSTDNHPVLNNIENHDYTIQQPQSVLSESSMNTLVEQDTTSTVQNLVNLNSPAISITSIASPDPGFIPPSERRPNSETKTKRPKRITPTPLCGNEVLPNIGKIASPQKPLVVIPEKANEMSYNGYVVCGESYKTPTTFEIQEHNPEISNGFEETSAHHCETPTSQFNPVNNVNTSFATSESNSIQIISDSYPELSQAEQCETSVCDIAMSPGGKNLLLHNKRSLKTALEENRMILSPITPVNQNSQSSSSTPNNQFPIPPCNLSKTIIKSPDKEFRKPNTTCASRATRASPRIAKLSKEKVAPTCYSLDPHDDKPSIVHGSTDEESFTAVPLGVISKRLCHVRNLDFGPEAVAVNGEDNPITMPKSKIEMRRVATITHLSSTALSTVSNGGKTVISLTDANVRDWKPKVSIAKKSASTENTCSNNTDKSRSPQLIIQRLSPQEIMPLTLVPKGKRKHRKARNLDQPETKVKPSPKILAAAKKVVSTKIPASAEPSALSKFSPLVKKGKASKKTKTSRHKKSTTSKSKKIVPPEIPVNTPSEIVNVPPEIVDILDADTKEFNQQFEIISSLSNSVPVIQSVDNTADNVNTGTISHLDSAAISFEQKETNEAAEVLASLSLAMPSNAFPPPVTTEQTTNGKRKAIDTSINDSWKSADSPNIVQKKKKRKKAPDLKSVNIDALLSKIKYK